MATIVNSMDRVISNSRRHNQISQILIKSFLMGMTGYSIFILVLTGSFYVISNLVEEGSGNIGSTVLVISSIGYLFIYSFLLIREMKKNNFCK